MVLSSTLEIMLTALKAMCKISGVGVCTAYNNNKWCYQFDCWNN